MHAKSVASVLSLAALPWLAPSTVHACSCAAAPLMHSIPADGDLDVPTNVALWIEGHAQGFTLAAEDGTEVAFKTEGLGGSGQPCGGGVWEVRPTTALAPHTRYTLTASHPDASPSESQISFETGAGPSKATVPETPTFEVVMATSRDWGGGTCSSRTQLCVRAELPAGSLGVLRMAADGGDEANAIYFDTPMHAARGTFGTTECYSLWLRDAAGRRSQARTVCDVPSLDADDQAVSNDGYSIDCDAAFAALAKADDGSNEDDAGVANDSTSGSGCSTAPAGGPGLPSLLWLTLLALALAPRGRARQGRRV